MAGAESSKPQAVNCWGFEDAAPATQVTEVVSATVTTRDVMAAAIDLIALSFCVLSRRHLITNKKAAGRPKDLADATWLEDEGK
jgi:hypothetical protein